MFLLQHTLTCIIADKLDYGMLMIDWANVLPFLRWSYHTHGDVVIIIAFFIGKFAVPNNRLNLICLSNSLKLPLSRSTFTSAPGLYLLHRYLIFFNSRNVFAIDEGDHFINFFQHSKSILSIEY